MIRVNRFPVEVLVELIAAHDGQSLSGTPVDRITSRIRASIQLARKAGLSELRVLLDLQDMQWLCDALDVDRLSDAIARLRVNQVAVAPAPTEFESHIAGFFGDGQFGSFPLIREPTHTPGFVQRQATETEKRELLHKFQVQAEAQTLQEFEPRPGARAH